MSQNPVEIETDHQYLYPIKEIKEVDKIKVYIAAKFEKREEAKEIAETLVNIGYDSVAAWVYPSERDNYSNEVIAILNVVDLKRADILVVKSAWGCAGTNSRAVELGLGLALGLEIWLIGNPENIYWHIPGLQWFASLTEMYAYAKGRLR